MSPTVILWSFCSSACVCFALIHFFIWARGRYAAHLLLSVASLSVAAVGIYELLMMHSATTQAYANAMRWIHVPIFFTIVSITCYVRGYFKTGPLWLMALVIAIRMLVVIVDFLAPTNVNYSSITALRPTRFLGGETVMVAVGVANPWSRVAQVGALLFVGFVLSASVELWQKGGRENRRRALLVGGSISLFSLLSVIQSLLVTEEILTIPYLISVPFLIPVVVLAFEMSDQVVQGALLAGQLETSRAALHKLEQRMRLAATAAELGFWQYDVTTGKVWLSDRANELLGWIASNDHPRLEELIPKVVEEDRDRIASAYNESLQENGFQTEFRMHTSGSAIRWLGVRGDVERDGSGNPVHLRGVISDITLRRKMEHELAKQRAELAHLSRVASLGELSAALAHELNQPLTAILSNAQAAARFLAQEPCDLQEVKSILKDIIDANHRAGETIRRLRRLFQKGQVERELIDVNSAIHEVLRVMHTDLINSRVVVRTHLAAQVPAVRGDQVQLHQVLINLFLNACDAMNSVESDSRRLTVSTFTGDKGQLRIDIADRGTGIPQGDLQRIFEPFVTTKPTGMGMGLAVCHTILAAHGGEIWASNNVDGGATIHISLPKAGAR
jgi:signal transduction histidine kinase